MNCLVRVRPIVAPKSFPSSSVASTCTQGINLGREHGDFGWASGLVIRLFMTDQPIVDDPDSPGRARAYELHRGIYLPRPEDQRSPRRPRQRHGWSLHAPRCAPPTRVLPTQSSQAAHPPLPTRVTVRAGSVLRGG